MIDERWLTNEVRTTTSTRDIPVLLLSKVHGNILGKMAKNIMTA
jgi:hypothetical protein